VHTNNEQYRTNHIWNVLNLKQEFDGIFSSARLGCKKPDQIFGGLFDLLKPDNKQDVLAWDDDQENVDSAE